MSTATDFVPGDPALMLTVLRSADGNLDHSVLLERILSLFCTDDDGNQVIVEDTPDLRRRIANAISHLEIAGLVHKTSDEKLAITSLGRAMMMAYPMGIDDGVLCSLPAFR